MLRKNLVAIFVAAAVGASGTAGAMPISSNLPDTVKNDPNLVLIHKGKKGHKHVQKKKWVYAPGKHGVRYREKRAGFYYYNGWWYPRPWWQFDPGIFICIGC